MAEFSNVISCGIPRPMATKIPFLHFICANLDRQRHIWPAV